MRSFRSILMTLVAGLLLAGCSTMTYYKSDKLDRSQGKPAILLMPPDVELSELSAGGVPELNAAWTLAGRENVERAIRERLNEMNATYAEYKAPPEDSPLFLKFDQLQKLHGAVGSTISVFHMNESLRLPTKRGKFDWTLGSEVSQLAGDSGADYALFTYVRDSYTSPGRAAMKLLAAALFGVYVQGGIQTGYASLVDLKTGDVVWFNYLVPREEGDLRTYDPAKKTMAMLLNELPK